MCRDNTNGVANELLKRLEEKGTPVRGDDSCAAQCNLHLSETEARRLWWYEPMKNKWKLRKKLQRRKRNNAARRAEQQAVEAAAALGFEGEEARIRDLDRAAVEAEACNIYDAVSQEELTIGAHTNYDALQRSPEQPSPRRRSHRDAASLVRLGPRSAFGRPPEAARFAPTGSEASLITASTKRFRKSIQFRNVEYVARQISIRRRRYFARSRRHFILRSAAVRDAHRRRRDRFNPRLLRVGHEGGRLCARFMQLVDLSLPEGLELALAGLGMNEQELSRNSRLTEFVVQDLNLQPKLPYDDASFDFVCNVVSVDYLNKPIQIFKEMHRVLKPGGTAIMSFSNRCFPTKAIAIWGQTDDSGHIWIVGSYYKFSAEWSDVKALDITERKEGQAFGDPMFVVQGTK